MDRKFSIKNSITSNIISIWLWVDHDEDTKLYLLSIINSKQDKLKDMQCINDERIKNGLLPLQYNELEDIISELKKDILLG